MQSAKYEKLRVYYERGLWSAERLALAVEKGWITALEYESITGAAYSAQTV